MATKSSDSERNDGSPSESEVTTEPMDTSTGGSVLGKRTLETRGDIEVEEEKKEGSSSEPEVTEVMETEGEDKDSDDSRWDKDSFDGREYHSSDSENDEVEDEIRLHRRQVIESKGFFDASLPPLFYLCGGIAGVPDLDDDDEPEVFNTRDFLSGIASECVEKYNDRKDKSVKFERVLRANFHPGSTTRYYITFMAKESDSPDAPDVEYQAKADRTAGKTYPILCRPSPPTKAQGDAKV